ncbi:MAG: hypothetical protein HAW66_10045, partial [Shewanella sp.]|nr:hypothetical protein [Shewanella sp.]
PHSSSHFTTINNNIISVREVDAQWQLDLYSIGELEHLYTQGLPNPVLAMFRNEIKTVIVEQDGNAVGFTLLRLGDGDGDFIPRWWEDKYGFSDEDPTDAELDTDGDQLSNLNEYFAGTNPLLVDSDGDLLSDYDEIHVHVTNPLILDSDEDGLSDGEEVLTYDTDPTRIDSDSDSFSDGDEVLKYNTDPNDANSVPEALAGFIEGFEANSLSAVWESIADSNANWELTESRSSNGNQSLRSGTIGDSQRSSVKFDGLFNGGSLTFMLLSHQKAVVTGCTST